MDNNEPVPDQPNMSEPNEASTSEVIESETTSVEIPSSDPNPIEDPIADAMKEPESAEAPALDLQSDAPFEQTTEVKTNVSPEAVTESEVSAESAPQSETPTEPATEEKVAAPSEATTQPEAPVEPIFEEKTEPKPADFAAPTVATDVKPTVVEKKKSHVGLVFLVIGIVFGVAAVIIAAIFLIPALNQ